MNIYQLLEKAGFEHKEVRVYLACLEFDRSTVLPIAKKANLKRTTTYEILKRLTNKGLVSFIEIKNRKRWFATNPNNLINLINERQKAVEQALPDIQHLYNQKQGFLPRVRYYEGENGVKTIYHDTLKCPNQTIRIFTKVDAYLEFPGERFMLDYVRERIKNNIHVKLLINNDAQFIHPDLNISSPKHLREVKKAPAELFFTNMIFLYANKVALCSTKKEMFGFIVESQEYYKTQAAWFEFIWKNTKD